jgi:hypothetical protein
MIQRIVINVFRVDAMIVVNSLECIMIMLVLMKKVAVTKMYAVSLAILLVLFATIKRHVE